MKSSFIDVGHLTAWKQGAVARCPNRFDPPGSGFICNVRLRDGAKQRREWMVDTRPAGGPRSGNPVDCK
jgi:hypothetical protein